MRRLLWWRANSTPVATLPWGRTCDQKLLLPHSERLSGPYRRIRRRELKAKWRQEPVLTNAKLRRSRVGSERNTDWTTSVALTGSAAVSTGSGCLCLPVNRNRQGIIKTWQISFFKATSPATRLQSSSVHVGFVIDKLALKRILSEYFGFPCKFSFHFSRLHIRGW
jgi:hypothetical protein